MKIVYKVMNGNKFIGIFFYKEDAEIICKNNPSYEIHILGNY